MVSKARYIPERGDIVRLQLNPQAGHEQTGRRPGLVLSPRTYNEKTSLAILCPVTSHPKGYPFEVALPPGLPIHGVVLADHVKSLDWKARKAALECKVPESVMDEVIGKLNALIG